MLNAIYDRRSIRQYKDTPVEPEKIQELLRAAMHAPTGKNTQLWEFIVVTDREVMKKFREVKPADMLDTAAALIVVCGDMEKNPTPHYYMGDCGAAAQTILLAAYEMGLGTCWLGIAPDAERQAGIRELFGMPETVNPFCGIAIGYPNEEKPRPERFAPEKIHYNKW